jgi:hypothetical protein
METIETGFEIYVSSFETICNAIENQLFNELQNGKITNHFLLFPKEFSPSEILYLSEAITQFTGVEGNFGIEENRREPYGCVFADILDKKWVSETANLTNAYIGEIQKHWIDAYFQAELTMPEWAISDQAELVKKFLNLCRIAAKSEKDLIQVWIL